MPNTDPLSIEKKVKTPNDFAGIHSAKQRTPVKNVMNPATSILPNLSLRRPVRGRPMAIPLHRIIVS